MGDVERVDPEGWVDRHGDSLYRYALLRLRAPDLAADVVQETFLEALRARESFAGRASERTWLFGILRHKIVDQIRKAVAPDGEIERRCDERSRSVAVRRSWPLARRACIVGGAAPAVSLRPKSSGRSSAAVWRNCHKGSLTLSFFASSTD